jgi:protein-S-isoprenylcysteine O-methyltransferase Ste14
MKKRLILLLMTLYPAAGLAFFLPAGTFKYWQAWVFIALASVVQVLAGIHLIRNDPKLLERRMGKKQKQKSQGVLFKLSFMPLLVAFVLPGFDIRYGWSRVPAWVSAVSFVCVAGGFYLCLASLKANTFASAAIEVEIGQKVISGGPYKLVRHPLYLSALILYVFAPPALGSFWAMSGSVPMFLYFAARIKTEEKELLQNLEGYAGYTAQTKSRLLPGVW